MHEMLIIPRATRSSIPCLLDLIGPLLPTADSMREVLWAVSDLVKGQDCITEPEQAGKSVCRHARADGGSSGLNPAAGALL